MQMGSHSVGSNSKNVVACHHKELLIQQESGKVHPVQRQRLLSCVVRSGPVFQRITIESLPDNVLLDIFDFYLVIEDGDGEIWDWEALVHVCRRWRYVVFGSPIRLDLRLICTERTPVRKSLDIWPGFPLVLRFYTESQLDNSEDSLDNLVAALEHCDRVRRIEVNNPADFLWNKLVTAMDEPFPALRSLWFDSLGKVVPLSHTFLNGSAPCLQDLTLRSISFPSLPRFLSSTSDLTFLDLFNIPKSGYIQPETMATCLSALPKLKSLGIYFRSPKPQPKRRNRPVSPPTRFVLPALTRLKFTGVSEYLEVLAARMDAPLLDHFEINFSTQLVFDIPQIIRFFGDLKSFRSSSLALEINSYEASMFFPSSTGRYALNSHSWHIHCERLDWQLFSLAQICSQILLFRCGVNSLVIESWSHPDPDNMDPMLWLQLFHSFPSVQNLTIHVELEPFIAAALQGLTGESATEVLPSLHSLSIIGNRSDEASQQGIQAFIAARQHSGCQISLSREVRTW
jgi:F-box-like